MSPTHRLLAGLVCLAVLAIGACSMPPTADAQGSAVAAVPERRLLVKLASPSADGDAIARIAQAVAGRPVRYLVASSAEWHSLGLRCGLAPECDRAIERLRADTSMFVAVQLDERRSPSATP